MLLVNSRTFIIFIAASVACLVNIKVALEIDVGIT